MSGRSDNACVLSHAGGSGKPALLLYNTVSICTAFIAVRPRLSFILHAVAPSCKADRVLWLPMASLYGLSYFWNYITVKSIPRCAVRYNITEYPARWITSLFQMISPFPIYLPDVKSDFFQVAPVLYSVGRNRCYTVAPVTTRRTPLNVPCDARCSYYRWLVVNILHYNTLPLSVGIRYNKA
jgi:hypothetical protein